jgi:hypothetical protein
MATVDCWPWFSPQYRAFENEPWAKIVVKAGAAVDGNGNIPIAPETLRANAERFLAQNIPQALAMMGGRLSLETYTYARYMASEAMGNSSTVEERVAVGEALKHRTSFGRSIYKLLTPSGYYGPIHGPSGVDSAPYGRWAATTRDPNVLTILLAHLVTSGASGNFSRGADDQANMLARGLAYGQSWVKNHAARGNFWVGHLPGVDHRKTFLYFTADPMTRALKGKELLARGLAALEQQPIWPPTENICNKPPKSGTVLAIASTVGIFVGGFIADRLAR